MGVWRGIPADSGNERRVTRDRYGIAALPCRRFAGPPSPATGVWWRLGEGAGGEGAVGLGWPFPPLATIIPTQYITRDKAVAPGRGLPRGRRLCKLIQPGTMGPHHARHGCAEGRRVYCRLAGVPSGPLIGLDSCVMAWSVLSRSLQRPDARKLVLGAECLTVEKLEHPIEG